MTPQTPEQIAGKLTKAQQKWLPFFQEEPRFGIPIAMSKRTRQSLVDAGLVVRHAPPSGFGYVRWSLSDTGLQVRAILRGDV